MQPSMVDLVAALILLRGIFLWNSTITLTNHSTRTLLLQVAEINIGQQEISFLLHSEPIELYDLARENNLLYR
jgi:hypothetical protein